MPPADLTLCPDCGRSIPRDAVRGMCMACMMRSVFSPDVRPEDVPPEESVRATFGSWSVLGLAGEGAFGLVYEASQECPIQRRAALKVLKPGLDSREVMARFAAERESLALLDHPGIARVLDAGTEDGRPWFAAEWVDGARSVTDFAGDRQLPVPDRIRLFRTICDAVAHAHQRGIIHRDLKPSNLLVSNDGAAKVIDFGIARATEQVLAHSTLVTLAGQVLGTPAYMSPEQAAGRGAEADTRSDIYSLGAVLYELLTGSPPFPRASLEGVPLHEALRIVREESPVHPSVRNSALRGELGWIISKALEKDPARRYETAAALSRDLGSWLGGGTILAAPPGRLYQLRTFLRRHRTAALGAAAVFAALVAGLAGTTVMFLRAREQELAASHSSERALTNEAAARRNASRGDHQTAQSFFDKGQPVTAVMHLARAARTDPTNHAAAERLLAELVWNDFPRLAHPPVELPEFIRFTGFSSDGSRLAVQCNEGNFSPGFTALFDVAAGRRVGPDNLPRTDVYGFAFSPDGKWLALATVRSGVQFFHAAGGTPAGLPPLPHSGPVRGVAWMGMDRVTSVEDLGDRTSTGRLWDLGSQRVLAETTGLHALAAPAIAPDNSRIAWVQADGMVRVVAARDGSAVNAWKTPGLGTAAFAGDNGTLAVLTGGERLRVYRVADGRQNGEAMQSSNQALTVLPAPGGLSAVTMGFDGITTLWDLASQRPVWHFPGRFLVGQFAEAGSLLVLGGTLQDDLEIWDMDRRRPARAPIPVAGASVGVALSPDGRWLACGGRQRRLSIYDLRPRAARPQAVPFPGNLWHAGWNADGSAFAALGSGARQAVWDGNAVQAEEKSSWARALAVAAPVQHAGGLRMGKVPEPADPVLSDLLPADCRGAGPPESLLCAAASPDGRWLAVGTAEPSVYLYDLAAPAGAPPRILKGSQIPSRLAFSMDSSRFAAGHADGSVACFSIAPPERTGVWQAHTTPVTAMAFLPGGRIVSGAEGRGVALSPPGRRTLVHAPVRQMAVSPDGNWYASGHDDGSALLWDARTGSRSGSVMRHPSGVSPAGLLLRFSPDSAVLATAGSFDNAVRLWSVPGGLEKAALAHPSLVGEICFDATGRRLATLCEDHHAGSLRLWDVDGGLPLMPPCTLPAGDGYMSLALHPAGTRAAVTGWRGAVFLYDLPPVLAEAPAWLAPAAEALAGWRFDAAGLPVTAGEAPVYPENSAWSRWLAAPLEERTLSPLSPQLPEAYRRTLRGIGTLEAFQELNQFQPSAGDALLMKALKLLRRESR